MAGLSPLADAPQSAVPSAQAAPPPQPYWLYLLECEDGVYYAGIALDVEQRFFQHVFGLGARFTRARPPVRVLAAREYASKGDALRAELHLKALPRAKKLAFFGQGAVPGPAAASTRRRAA
ncbi:GIY-YIG nuclease family protein [uncultured Ramlibacter sp.]|uniref:GIY-YIG nuclease family protein n=1 Tax=uncultured Ramlibacter sp. TaxID=260755 RepID=UPI002628B38C|nr:GIY-YIG nuclease family protein [uncultured Ramlibacter sp.]